jgi:hypothetical protein
MGELLKAMYPMAVKVGIPADKYWSMTYGEIMEEIDAISFRRESELKEKAMLDYTSAQLITKGFHQPDKMPKIEEAYKVFEDLGIEFIEEEEVEHLSLEEQRFLKIFGGNFDFDEEGGASDVD